MDRSGKTKLVASLKETLSSSSIVVVTQQSGLTVAEVSELRQKMRNSGASYKVTKNTLSRLAVSGTPHEGLVTHLSGPTALAFSQDPVAAAKVAVDYANQNEKLTIVAGCLNGKILSKAEVESLAKLPSLDALRGKIIGVISAPAQKLAAIAQAPAGQLARVFAAYGKSTS